MANAIELGGYAGHSRESSLLNRLRSKFAEFREYRKLREELAALSDRELADIGISRARIGEIAWQGTRRR